MRKLALVCSLSVLLIASTATWAEVGVDFGVSSALTSDYVFRGAKMAPTGLASDLFATYAITDRFSINGYVWNYTMIDVGRGVAESDYDLSLTYTPPWWDDLFTITGGWIYYDQNNSPGSAAFQGEDAGELYGSVTVNRWGWDPTVSVYYDYDPDLTNPLRDVGTYINLSAGRDWDLSSGWTLDLAAAVGLDFGRVSPVNGSSIDTFRDAVIHTGLSWELEKGLTFGPAIDWWFPSHQVDPGANGFRPVGSLFFDYVRSW